jgi:four helix bundle protein
MASVRRFEDLEVWQKARVFSKEINSLIKSGVFRNDFKLMNQLRDSSGSIMDNIAEGFDRGGNKEFSRFLGISKGSTGEAKSQLYRSLDNEYITKEVFSDLYNKADEINRMIASLICYLSNSDIKGQRYKTSKVEDKQGEYFLEI